jgi:hypothetical protein
MPRMSVVGTWTAITVSSASAFVAPYSALGTLSQRSRPAAVSMVAAAPRSANSAVPSVERQFTSILELKEKQQVSRAEVLCGICGQQKKGHCCTGPPPMSDVPIQGSARRHHGFDRRQRQQMPKEPEPAVEARSDLPPTPPLADERDALQQHTIHMFNAWAMDGESLCAELRAREGAQGGRQGANHAPALLTSVCTHAEPSLQC